MPVDVKSEIIIRVPPERVAAFTADPQNAPLWYENIKSVNWVTPPPLTAGSRVAFVAHFLRRRLVYTYEIVDYLPGERLTMRTAEGPFPMETTYTWRRHGHDHTLMTLRNRGEPSGFSRLVAPLMATAVRRANKKDLLNLRRRLEHTNR